MRRSPKPPGLVSTRHPYPVGLLLTIAHGVVIWLTGFFINITIPLDENWMPVVSSRLRDGVHEFSIAAQLVNLLLAIYLLLEIKQLRQCRSLPALSWWPNVLALAIVGVLQVIAHEMHDLWS